MTCLKVAGTGAVIKTWKTIWHFLNKVWQYLACCLSPGVRRQKISSLAPAVGPHLQNCSVTLYHWCWRLPVWCKICDIRVGNADIIIGVVCKTVSFLMLPGRDVNSTVIQRSMWQIETPANQRVTLFGKNGVIHPAIFDLIDSFKRHWRKETERQYNIIAEYWAS